ncbi:MAG TPA: NAD(P)-dependent alcohol dehydrogenase [Burkholderiales bacterium]|nr:NAD(P)-dependent alcohol dehydrogenase [Burkholderiales bacterium]
MKVFQIQDDWGMEHLQLAERPEPKPGPGQVLLRMKAASLNYRDLLVPERGYGAHTGTLPLIPLSDGVGEVIELGAGVTRVKLGERACPCFTQGWISGPPAPDRAAHNLGGPLDGTMAEMMCLPEDAVVRVPQYLSDEQAATLPCAALTAWSALMVADHLAPGAKVLVQGTGGVALFALQFAKLAGAHVTVISSSDEKIARAKALGADAAINYKATPEWAKATLGITGGRGYEHVLELGGEKTLPQSLLCVATGGTISIIGVLSGGTMSAQLGRIVMKQVRMVGIGVGNRDGFEAMLRAMALHGVQPVVDRVFAFEQLKEAMAHLSSGAHFGKVCIRHGSAA